MEEVVQPEVGPLGFPVDREILFQALQGERFGDITGDDSIHDVGGQEGQFAQAVDLPGVEVVAIDQCVDRADAAGYQLLVPLQRFQQRFLQCFDRAVMGLRLFACWIDQLGFDAAAL